MDIQAEKQWIKSELDKVNDPYLLDLFKRLLAYREHSLQGEMEKMLLEAEEDVRQGNVLSHEELGDRMKQWRK